MCEEPCWKEYKKERTKDIKIEELEKINKSLIEKNNFFIKENQIIKKELNSLKFKNSVKNVVDEPNLTDSEKIKYLKDVLLKKEY
jgi:hypothetical protein